MPDAPLTEHPIPWDQLVPYEQEQGGYWLYGPGCDVYGNGRQWVSVPRPEQPGELTAAITRVRNLAASIRGRARETGNPGMAELATALDRAATTTEQETDHA